MFTKNSLLLCRRAILITILASFTLIGYAQFAGGSGTLGDPYEVTTAEQLNNVRDYLDSYFRQTADIDLSPEGLQGEDWYDQEEGWLPIGTSNSNFHFRGHYDGNNHLITNLTINRLSHYQALFAYMNDGATIKNLGLKDVSIYGNSYSAGIAGYMRNGAVIESCFVNGEVKGINYVAGLTGMITDENSMITNCYTVVNIHTRSTSRSHYAGGISGFISNGSEVINCYTSASIRSEQESLYVGAIIGRTINSSVSNLYWNTDLADQLPGVGSGAEIQGNSMSELLLPETYSGFEFNSVWSIADGSTPYLTWEGEASDHNYPPLLPPLNLSTVSLNNTITLSWAAPDSQFGVPAGYNIYRNGEMINEDLESVLSYEDTGLEYWTPYRYSVTAVYSGEESIASAHKLTALYEFAGGSGTAEDPFEIATAEQLFGIRYGLGYHYRQVANIDLGVAPWNRDEGWMPIGSEANRFRGTFNGNGYRITNLTMHRNLPDQGLFGYVEYSVLQNVNLMNIDINVIEGTHNGGLVGRADHSEISRVEVTGDIYSTALYGWGVGGIVGFPDVTEILDSSFIGNITGNDGRLGGISGYHHTGSVIRRCYTDGSIDIIPESTGWIGSIGGLVGNADGGDIHIEDSYSRMSVNGERWSIGGLVGSWQSYNGSMTRCYFAGQVTANHNEPSLGPIVGTWMYSNYPTNTYYDRDVTGYTWCASRAEHRSTNEMTYPNYGNDTYQTWDFNNVWANDEEVINDGYPILWFQEATTPEYNLSVNISGQGTTTPETGNYLFEEGEEVELTATADQGWRFDHWLLVEGGAQRTEETATVNVVMNYNVTATAHFIEVLDIPEPVIEISAEGFVELSWNEIDRANSYRIYWSNSPFANSWNLLTTVTDTHFTEPLTTRRFYYIMATSQGTP